MPIATISDYWAPDIWIRGAREAFATFPSLWNSSAVARSPQFDQLASGGGLTVNVPFFSDISDQDDELQVEDTAPETTHGHGGEKQVGVFCNRVTKNAVTALSAAITGEDPVGDMVNQIAFRRQKQRQKTFLSMLDGAFEPSGPLASIQLSDTFSESESGQSDTDDFIDADMVIDSIALLGEIDEQVENGVILMHPVIHAALLKKDATSFEKESRGAFMITTYKGMQVIRSSALVRDGTTDGYVYKTYVLKRRFLAYGEKPQVGDRIDVASMQYEEDKEKNNSIVYDRGRFLMHINGLVYGGSPSDADAGPTNAELATPGDWTLGFSSANRCGGVRIQTNG